ncbi:hypothetical protein OAM78_04055 [Alphaproteobacteria bacterium]|nr:hypothetical protein [Alphaproteobacteria bacterium]
MSCPKKLIVFDRAALGPSNGPQQIVNNILAAKFITEEDYIFFDGDLTSLDRFAKTKNVRPRLGVIRSCVAFVLVLFRLNRRIRGVVIFGTFNFRYYLASRLLLRGVKVTVIGYDCFTKTWLMNLKKSSGIELVRFVLRFCIYFLKESAILMSGGKLLLVSKRCSDFMQMFFTCSPSQLGILSTMPTPCAGTKKICSSRKVILLGPCKSGLDKHNCSSVLRTLKSNGFLNDDIILFGDGFFDVSLRGMERIDFVENFGEWATKNSYVLVSLRAGAPGIQTKVQNLLLSGNVIFADGAIDVTPMPNILIRNIEDLKPNSFYKNANVNFVELYQNCLKSINRMLM